MASISTSSAKKSLSLISWLLFGLISYTLINLFSGFGSTDWAKAFWIVSAIVIAGISFLATKLTKGYHALINPALDKKEKNKDKYWKKRNTYIVSYCLTLIFTVTSAIGFTLTDIRTQSSQAEATALVTTVKEKDTSSLDRDIADLTKDIASKDATIQDYADKIKRMGEDSPTTTAKWTSLQKTAEKEKEVLKTNRADKEAERDKIKAENATLKAEVAKTEAVKSATIYDNIASIIPFNPSGEMVRNFLMLLLSVILEYFMFITAAPIKLKEDEEETIEVAPVIVESPHKDYLLISSLLQAESQEKIFQYIEGLFDIGKDSTRLNSDAVVSEKTGLPLADCKKYKKLLFMLSYKKSPLFTSGKGGTKSNFSKEDVIRVIKFMTNVGVTEESDNEEE